MYVKQLQEFDDLFAVFYGHSTMPLTPDQEAQMLSHEDRLGLAEYVIAKSREANRLAEMGKDELMASANLADLIKKGDTSVIFFVFKRIESEKNGRKRWK